MGRPIDDDDEDRHAGWWGRFFRGIVVSVLLCGVAVWALSIYVLPPPPEPPAPPAAGDQAAEAGAGGTPATIAGIEVSTAPAYTAPSGTAGEEIGPIQLDGPALTVNATAFTIDPATPLVAVVLDDAAADPLLHPVMFALDLPLTIGVVAGKDGDRVTAKAAWEAGYEVVAELQLVGQGEGGGVMLEFGLTQEEAGNRTAALMRRLPMAVAASRPLDSPAPPDAGVLNGIDSALAPHGFGYVDVGVAEDGESIAMAAGLITPVAASRFSIPAGADAAEAHATLDRAAAAAARDGAAVVYATPGEQLFLALQLWGGAGSEGVARLAPLSAVIARRQAG